MTNERGYRWVVTNERHEFRLQQKYKKCKNKILNIISNVQKSLVPSDLGSTIVRCLTNEILLSDLFFYKSRNAQITNSQNVISFIGTVFDVHFIRVSSLNSNEKAPLNGTFRRTFCTLYYDILSEL